MDAHVANAQRVAEWLEADERVAWVRYAGLPGHPHHERAQRYLPQGPGAVFSFGVRGDDEDAARAAGRRFIESVQLCSHLANIGDARTLVLHPGVDHPPAADRRPAARGRRAGRTSSASASGSRTPTTSSGTSTRPSPRRRRWPRRDLGPRPPPRSARRSCAGPAASRWSAPRRTRRAPSNFVATYLLGVHRLRRLLRQPERRARSSAGRCTRRSTTLPVTPDLVDVFRRPEDLPDVLDDVRSRVGGADVLAAVRALRRGAGRARRRAAGLTVVMDRCLKVEHARFHGGLHLAGLRHRRDQRPQALISGGRAPTPPVNDQAATTTAPTVRTMAPGTWTVDRAVAAEVGLHEGQREHHHGETAGHSAAPPRHTSTAAIMVSPDRTCSTMAPVAWVSADWRPLHQRRRR